MTTSRIVDGEWVCTCPTLNRRDGHYTCATCGTEHLVLAAPDAATQDAWWRAAAWELCRD